ncbi:MAG: hypothetical protein QGH76_05415 [Phycisphaerales bacterium]|jgi:hypothetical protein|nr:hypothetical protein [Phycisphaerales bacterium]
MSGGLSSILWIMAILVLILGIIGIAGIAMAARCHRCRPADVSRKEDPEVDPWAEAGRRAPEDPTNRDGGDA